MSHEPGLADPADSILDVGGLRVGHATDAQALTGCTVVLPPEGTVGGVDLRGGACGLREVQTLQADQLATHVHAICLAGGSAFGLAAADGVMRRLDEAGIGFEVGNHRVPIVPSAILFDLALGDGRVRPDPRMGWMACDAALAGTRGPMQGNVGAGAGASVGKLHGVPRATKTGLGSASESGPHGVVVGALAVVNAFGDVVDPSSTMPIAGLRDAPEGRRLLGTEQELILAESCAIAGFNTTLAVLATDLWLDKVGCARVAAMAQRALLSTIRPCHTRFDGDVVFCLATGRRRVGLPLESIGVLAARALQRAVLRSALWAEAAGGLPSALQLVQPAVRERLLRETAPPRREPG